MKNTRKFSLEDSSDKKKSKTEIPSHFVGKGKDTDKLDEATQLWITVIDVGQGESTLIRYRKITASGWTDVHVVMVDGGRAHFARHTIRPTLKELGVKFINTIICTHYDADHMEGLSVLGIKCETVYERGEAKVRGDDDKVGKFRKVYADKIKVMRKGQVIKLGDDEQCPTIKCLAVDNTGVVWSEENDYSIALSLKFGKFSFYLGGDLTANVEDKFGDLGHCCAFKCGHHGSKHSTSDTFLTKITPSAAIISAASHSYCHPDDETLKRLCDKSEVKKIYLTNCVYNRAGVNTDFEEQEKSLRLQLHSKIWDWLTKNKNFSKDKPEGFNDIVALGDKKNKEEAYKLFEELLGKGKLTIKGGDIQSKFEFDKDARKKWNELANYYFAAFDVHHHLETRKTRELKGIVAATENHLGNIHLIVSGADAFLNHKYKVHFYDGAKMKMIAHDCESKMAVAAVDSDLEYVKTVKRDNSYKFISSFSLWTGPSGEERKLITPNELMEFSDRVSELCDFVYGILYGKSKSMYDDGNEEFGEAVRGYLKDGSVEDENPDLDYFIEEYEELLDTYHTLLESYKKGTLDRAPMEPKKKILEAL